MILRVRTLAYADALAHYAIESGIPATLFNEMVLDEHLDNWAAALHGRAPAPEEVAAVNEAARVVNAGGFLAQFRYLLSLYEHVDNEVLHEQFADRLTERIGLDAVRIAAGVGV